MLALADDAALARLVIAASPRPQISTRLQTSKELAAARAELHRLRAIDCVAKMQRDSDATLN